MPQAAIQRNNEDVFGEETPRKGPVSYVIEMEREREREMLEALRFVWICRTFMLLLTFSM